MGNCPKCGAAQQSGRFCASCGAQLDQGKPAAVAQTGPVPQSGGQMPPPPPPTYGGQPQPPAYGHPQPPAYGQPQPPVYGQPQPPAYGQPQPPVYGQPQPPAYGQPQPPAYGQPPVSRPKSRTALWVLSGIGAVVGMVIARFLLAPSAPEPVDPLPPKETPAVVQPNTPPPNPAPKPPEPPPKPRQVSEIFGTSLKHAGSGQVDYNFVAFDWFSHDTVAVARDTTQGLEVAFLGFEDGDLKVLSTVERPLGRVRDITFGSEVENGNPLAYVVGEKGLVWVGQNGLYSWVEDPTIRRVYVGDFDGDGKSERVTFREKENDLIASVTRYKSVTETEQLGEFEADDLPNWTSSTLMAKGPQRMLIGVEPVDGKSTEVLLFSIDYQNGLAVEFSGTIPDTDAATLLGVNAAMIDGKPTLVAAYLADRSYIELFDITANGPVSRGRITLPDGEPYYPLVGSYGSNRDLPGILAVAPDGQWHLFTP